MALLPDHPLETARLLLRPFRDADLHDLHAFHSLPEVARFVYWDARKDLDETRQALERKKTEVGFTDESDTLCLAVALKDAGTVIGEVYLFRRSRPNAQGEIGYVFHPDHGGRGYATEAARAVLALGFDGGGGLHRIYGRCDPRNTPSWRVMERLGMRREAHFLHHEIFKGVWGEEYVYALLEHEWRASQQSL